jgi:hypothetical protein
MKWGEYIMFSIMGVGWVGRVGMYMPTSALRHVPPADPVLDRAGFWEGLKLWLGVQDTHPMLDKT